MVESTTGCAPTQGMRPAPSPALTTSTLSILISPDRAPGPHAKTKAAALSATLDAQAAAWGGATLEWAWPGLGRRAGGGGWGRAQVAR